MGKDRGEVKKPQDPAPQCHGVPMQWDEMFGNWECRTLAHWAEIITKARRGE